jgi:hypothetical protein
MKFVSALFLGLTLSLLVSCSGDPILKTWKLDNMDVEALLKEMPKETQDMMRKGAKENMDKTRGKVVFKFEEGGKFSAENPNMDGTTMKQAGTWKMAADKKSFTADIKGEKQIFTIHELSSDKLVIEPKDQKMKLIFIPKN